MKVKLVFSDWRNKDHKSIYDTERGIDLSLGSFHSGTTFDAEIDLDLDDQIDLKEAFKNGDIPVFYVLECSE